MSSYYLSPAQAALADAVMALYDGWAGYAYFVYEEPATRAEKVDAGEFVAAVLTDIARLPVDSSLPMRFGS